MGVVVSNRGVSFIYYSLWWKLLQNSVPMSDIYLTSPYNWKSSSWINDWNLHPILMVTPNGAIAVAICTSVGNVAIMWQMTIVTRVYVAIVASTTTAIWNVAVNEIRMPQRRTPSIDSSVSGSCDVHNIRLVPQLLSTPFSIKGREQVGLGICGESSVRGGILIWVLLLV